MGTSTDITGRKQAEEALHQLTPRLLQAQDEERRRIAREIHDATGQRLLTINLNLARLDRSTEWTNEFEQQLLRETRLQVQQAMQELRTLSYLLHPPLLDQAGLVSALQWYVDGFSERSGVQVELVALPEIGRLPEELETALYRVVQECLTNIHRHSGSASAFIRLRRTAKEIVLQVKDEGVGMPPGWDNGGPDNVRSIGVGIPGMRERIRQLGGRLEIRSTKKGTTITAKVPHKKGGNNGHSHPTG
jgi:signal transduction histidine kinase